MSPGEFDPIQFGQLQERVQNLTDAVDRLDTAVEKLSSTIAETRGGWKMLVTLGTVVAAAASGLTWLAAHVKVQP